MRRLRRKRRRAVGSSFTPESSRVHDTSLESRVLTNTASYDSRLAAHVHCCSLQVRRPMKKMRMLSAIVFLAALTIAAQNEAKKPAKDGGQTVELKNSQGKSVGKAKVTPGKGGKGVAIKLNAINLP